MRRVEEVLHEPAARPERIGHVPQGPLVTGIVLEVAERGEQVDDAIVRRRAHRVAHVLHAVRHVEPVSGRAAAGFLDGVGRQVEARHAIAAAGQRARMSPPATADVENGGGRRRIGEPLDQVDDLGGL